MTSKVTPNKLPALNCSVVGFSVRETMHATNDCSETYASSGPMLQDVTLGLRSLTLSGVTSAHRRLSQALGMKML